MTGGRGQNRWRELFGKKRLTFELVGGPHAGAMLQCGGDSIWRASYVNADGATAVYVVGKCRTSVAKRRLLDHLEGEKHGQ